MNPSAAPALKLTGVTHYYGSKAAVRQASLEIAPGEIVTIVGTNGAGKSTLLRVGGGVMTPHKGRAEVFGFARRSTSAIRSRVRPLSPRPRFWRRSASTQNLSIARA